MSELVGQAPVERRAGRRPHRPLPAAGPTTTTTLAADLSCPVTRSTSVRSSTPFTRPTCGAQNRGVVDDPWSCQASSWPALMALLPAPQRPSASAPSQHPASQPRSSAASSPAGRAPLRPRPRRCRRAPPAASPAAARTLESRPPPGAWQGRQEGWCKRRGQAGAGVAGRGSRRHLPASATPHPHSNPPHPPTCMPRLLSVESGSRLSTRTVPSNMPAARKRKRWRPSGTGASARQATSPPSSRFSASTSMPCAVWVGQERGTGHRTSLGEVGKASTGAVVEAQHNRRLPHKRTPAPPTPNPPAG